MEFAKLITENSLVLVPVIFVVGLILKGTEKVADKYIPAILLPIGIASAVALTGLNAESVMQGVLVTGAAVYTNQLVKQITKVE